MPAPAALIRRAPEPPMRGSGMVLRGRALAWIGLVWLLAFLSFRFDVFGVVGLDSWRTQGSVSEELVLDGVLRAGEPGAAAPLGRYVRPEGAPASRQAWREAFERQERAPVYRSYRSQFGLQGMVWARIHAASGASLSAMHTINAAVLAAAVAVLFGQISALLGRRSGVLFAAAMGVSPWPVVFGQDLYWVMSTWLWPMVLGFALGRRAWREPRVWLLWLALLGGLMLLKLLCGYEYLSTVALAAAVPCVYFGIRDGHGWRRLMVRLLAMAGVSAAALVVAMILHTRALPDEQAGWSAMVLLIEKRLYSPDPLATAQAACRDDFFAEPDCVPSYLASLQVSPWAVLGRYLAFDDFLPWLSHWTHPAPEGSREILRAALRAGVQTTSVQPLWAAVRAVGWPGVSRPVVRVLNGVAFGLLLGALVWRLYRLRRRAPALIGMMVCALAAPVSWFVLAKGHSSIHTTLNYVLWYVPFVPLAFAVLGVRGEDAGQVDAVG